LEKIVSEIELARLLATSEPGYRYSLKFDFAIPIPSMQMIGGWMHSKIHNLPVRHSESEKITINLGFVDLGQVDLLVRQGFYSNRTDFIRTAIRTQLATHAEAVRQSVQRQTLEMGLRRYSRTELEAARAAGKQVRVHVLGLAIIDDDVTADLALATIESISVLGALQINPALRAALADRIA
jgi:Arc/MetJ-type ribon-helix-helix transcriptional regulator